MTLSVSGATGTRARGEGQLERLQRDGDLEGAARQFEALLVNQMLQSMRRTIPDDGFLPGSLPQNVYTEMLDQELSQSVTGRGQGLGIAPVIVRQLQAYVPPTQVHGPPSQWLPPLDGETTVVGFFGELLGGPEGGISTEVRLEGRAGSKVRAPAWGRVLAVQPDDPAAGTATVLLEHSGGYRTTLRGLAGVAVRSGESVLAGRSLGTVPGSETWGTIGFAASDGEEPLDPLSLVGTAGGEKKTHVRAQALY